MFYPRHILDLRNSKSLIFFVKPLNLMSFGSATPTGSSQRRIGVGMVQVLFPASTSMNS